MTLVLLVIVPENPNNYEFEGKYIILGCFLSKSLEDRNKKSIFAEKFPLYS